ncbi:MAG: coproporphyrinogen dehydrogenase HemZ [Bacillota bacterium]
MKIILEDAAGAGLARVCRDVAAIFFSAAEIGYDCSQRADLRLLLEGRRLRGLFNGKAIIYDAGGQVATHIVAEKPLAVYEEKNQLKRLVKLAVFRVLAEYTGKRPPWGILTGIRPTKVVHRLLDDGWPAERIHRHLVEDYGLAREKADLLIEVTGRHRRYLPDAKTARRLISVYVGIPFCPTRCAYCSFPAYPMERWGHLTEDFLAALLREIKVLGDRSGELGFKVQTVYIGGGTPTSLNADQMERLLAAVRRSFISESTVEFTLEAGRPDTITAEKMQLAKHFGVNRISVNPQSMNPDTLRAIGRSHDPEEIVTAVQAARAAGLDFINMDIIAGLPGETPAEFGHTLNVVAGLKPENLTVHTLAVKRASSIKENFGQYRLPEDKEVREMLDQAQQTAVAMDMHPYYLYRQKQMVGLLENVGYAREGYDCIYNVQIIEERQTVLALGAGAGSKFVRPDGWILESLYNPKDPQNYIGRIDGLIAGKVDKLYTIR